MFTEFQTRRAHRVCFSDKDLLAYLLAIVVIIIGYMSAWTALVAEGFAGNGPEPVFQVENEGVGVADAETNATINGTSANDQNHTPAMHHLFKKPEKSEADPSPFNLRVSTDSNAPFTSLVERRAILSSESFFEIEIENQCKSLAWNCVTEISKYIMTVIIIIIIMNIMMMI